MKKFPYLIPAIGILLAIIACSITPSPTDIPASSPSGPCQVSGESDLVIYNRPSEIAEIFSTLPAGEQVTGLARTANGWIGFDPGIAQAANIGVFRYRWIKENDEVQLDGDCFSLPIVEGPLPGICYTMLMDSIDVYLQPDSDSDVLTTLNAGDYVSVIARTENWAQVDLNISNLILDIIGWIPSSALNMNGPCSELPIVTPE